MILIFYFTFTNKMIFVTGGTGLLGAYLLTKLTETEDLVYASKRKHSDTKPVTDVFNFMNKAYLLNKIKWIDCDLSDYHEISNIFSHFNITQIYNCAASVSYKKSESEKIINNNIAITRNLINVSLDSNIETFCHVSSIAALGTAKNGEKYITEHSLWEDNNTSAYSKSKYLSELEVWRGIHEGLNAVIVQPSVIIGVSNKNKGFANIFRKIKKGMKFYTTGSTGFVDVRDLVEIMITLTNNPEYLKTSYIINAENITYKLLFEKIAKLYNTKPPSIKASNLLLEIAWRIEYLKSILTNTDPVITSISAKTSKKQLHYSNKKLLDTIKFKFNKIDNSLSFFSKYLEK